MEILKSTDLLDDAQDQYKVALECILGWKAITSIILNLFLYQIVFYSATISSYCSTYYLFSRSFLLKGGRCTAFC